MSVPVIDWRSGWPARLAGAAVVGALTGATALLAGWLMPSSPVPVDCRPAGGVGCAVAGPIAGLLIGLLLWLLVVVVAMLAAGGLLGWLAGRLMGVRLGVVVPVVWPVTLWATATLLRPVGVTLYLKGWGAVGYVAVAFVLTAVLTAPQFRLAARLIATGALVLAVVVVFSVR
ncbi:MAG TPA: hypothetical protein VF892_16800 [Pseudonocardiaceae bacterium]